MYHLAFVIVYVRGNFMVYGNFYERFFTIYIFCFENECIMYAILCILRHVLFIFDIF